jgi:phenylpyruvate tautomerase PptA (4-oxalocrotonate tautomerase family)
MTPAGLVKVGFPDLRSGMLVAKAVTRVYEVLVASKDQAIMMKDQKTAVVITREEFENDDWYTAVKRRQRRTRGKAKD